MASTGVETVPWNRLLFPDSSPVPILSNGFLEDPQNAYPTDSAQLAVQLQDLDSAAALITGEPGIGKSWTLRAESQRLHDAGRPARFVDLVGLNAEDTADAIIEAIDAVGPDGTVLADGLDRTVGTIQSIARALHKA